MIKVSPLYFIVFFFFFFLRLVCNEVVCERDGRSLAIDPPVILWGERLEKKKEGSSQTSASQVAAGGYRSIKINSWELRRNGKT